MIRSLFAYIASHGNGRSSRHRDFAIMELAGCSSWIGMWMHQVAIGWLTWRITGAGAGPAAGAPKEASSAD